jgi:hypothetical protein
MRYLKSFNEAVEPDEIKDFCEMYLAYLLDEGYALAFRESGRVTQIDFVKPKTDVEHIAVDWMDWDDIKDSFIPFLKMLDREYDVKDNLITFQTRGAVQVKVSFQDVIDDKVKEKIFSVTKGYKNHDYDHATVISSITIPVLDHSVGQYSWQLKTNESVKEDELLEFTQDRLAYLIDDGFDLTTRDTQNGYWREYNIDCTRISIVKRSGFTWEEVTDRFSPYIYMLNKEYSILEIVFHQSGGRQYQYDTRKDLEELVSGESDQYLTNKFFWMVTIIVKK